ncbi:MAG: HutD family protein [Lachnospiraceae bacterium]|nr:HutD family protein [Lachnospiraceae bacterium]MBR5789702.1 HutD family protein [Lachnospiraceae bacterium]
MIKVVKKEDYKVSEWSGGVTKEILILPEEGDYSERRFHARVSSAVVEAKESDFTELKGVHRFISLVHGDMELHINDNEPKILSPLDIVEFEGEDKVHCIGKATDFNLMLKGANGRLSVLPIGVKRTALKGGTVLIFAIGAVQVRFSNADPVELSTGDSCVITNDDMDYLIYSERTTNVLVAEIEGE